MQTVKSNVGRFASTMYHKMSVLFLHISKLIPLLSLVFNTNRTSGWLYVLALFLTHQMALADPYEAVLGVVLYILNNLESTTVASR